MDVHDHSGKSDGNITATEETQFAVGYSLYVIWTSYIYQRNFSMRKTILKLLTITEFVFCICGSNNTKLTSSAAASFPCGKEVAILWSHDQWPKNKT